jgi:hypothetical protein
VPTFTYCCAVLWAAVVACCCIPDPTGTAPTPPPKAYPPEKIDEGTKPTLVIDVADVCEEYLADERAADAKYKGRSVEFTAVVASDIPVYPDGNAYGMFDSRLKRHCVSIVFQRSQTARATALKKGQTIKVRARFGMGTVIDRKKPDLCVHVSDAVLID